MNLNEITLRQYVTQTSEQHYVMTGAVIATLAAQATALAEACVQISLDNQLDRLDWQAVSHRIEQIGQLRKKLLQGCHQEINVLGDYLLYQQEDDSSNCYLLCESCSQIGQLSLEVAQLLVEFRPAVFEEIVDDLDITINLLVNAAQATHLLLTHYLAQSSDPALRQQYEPHQKKLIDQITHLENKAYV